MRKALMSNLCLLFLGLVGLPLVFFLVYRMFVYCVTTQDADVSTLIPDGEVCMEDAAAEVAPPVVEVEQLFTPSATQQLVRQGQPACLQFRARSAGGHWEYPFPQHLRISGSQSADCGFYSLVQDGWRAGWCVVSGGQRKSARIYMTELHGTVHIKIGDADFGFFKEGACSQ